MSPALLTRCIRSNLDKWEGSIHSIIFVHTCTSVHSIPKYAERGQQVRWGASVFQALPRQDEIGGRGEARGRAPGGYRRDQTGRVTCGNRAAAESERVQIERPALRARRTRGGSCASQSDPRGA